MRSGSGFLAIAFLLISTSCNNPDLWGQSRAEILRALESRDYGFIDGIEASLYDRILAAGDGAAYYLGLHLTFANRPVEARLMFLVGAEKSDEPYRSLCRGELTKVGTPLERLESVRSRIRELSDRSAASGNTAASRAEGDELERLKNLAMQLEIETSSFEKDSPDLRLWFYSRPMTKSLAELVPSLPEGLPAEFYGIAATRAAVFRREYGTSWENAQRILEAGTEDALYRPVLSDFCKAALYGAINADTGSIAACTANAAFLDRIAASRSFTKSETAEAPFVLAFYAGRLYAAAAKASPLKPAKSKAAGENFYALAQERFKTALTLAKTDTDYDSALWYILESAISRGNEAFFTELEFCAPLWKNPAWFSDLLDGFIVDRVSARDIASIVRVYRALGGLADCETTARLGYLSARSGRLDAEASDVAYRDAFLGDHGSLYYRVMAAEALGLPFADTASLYSAGKNGSGHASCAGSSAGVGTRSAFDSDKVDEAEKVLGGFIEYHLPERLYAVAVARYPGLPVSVASRLATRLEADGDYSEAARLMLYALRFSDGPITDDELRLIFPRPYLAEVSAAAKRFGLSEYLVYAMIRSESLFNASVTSGAGAFGLTQLMRPTASDIASKLDYSSYDLNDPATNITFGTYYLSEMIRRMDGAVLPALFAYNAGITRVRSWQKAATGQGDDFFLESLPYGETREYGRKVLAAAAVYGYLYYQKTPGQVVRELF